MRYWVVGLTYLAAWFVLDYTSYLFEVMPGVSAWYPPAGLTLAFLMVFGVRFAPLLVVGPLISGVTYWLPGDVVASAWIGISIAVVYGTASYALRRAGIAALPTSLRDAAIFTCVVAVSSIGVAALATIGLAADGLIPTDNVAHSILSFWAGDLLGILGLGPAFLVAWGCLKRRLDQESVVDLLESYKRPKATRPGPWTTSAQAFLTLAALALAPHSWSPFSTPPLYFVIVPVIWIALSHGAFSNALAVAAVSVGALASQLILSDVSPLLDTQLLLTVCAITGLLISSATIESDIRRAENVAQQLELERHQAVQTALRDIEENLSNAQLLSNMGSWRLDAHSGELWWSAQVYRILGIDPTSVAPTIEAFIERVHPDDRRHFTDILNSDARRVEFRVRRGDGEWRLVRSIRDVMKTTPDGRPLVIAGTTHDITEEARVVAALRESREQLEAIASNLPGFIYRRVLSADGKFRLPYVGRNLKALLGLSTEEDEKSLDCMIAAIHPVDRERFLDSLNKSAQSLAPWQQHFRAVMPDGQMRWYHAMAKTEKHPNGDIVWDTLVLDVTEQRLTEEQWHRSEERFRIIAANAPMGIATFSLTKDVRSEIAFANETCERLFGYGPGEMAGIAMRDLHAEEDDKERIADLVKSTGIIDNQELLLRRRDGSSFWGQVCLRRICPENSPLEPVLLLAVSDITNLKSMQSALTAHTQALGERIKELRCLYTIAWLTSDSSRPLEQLCDDIVRELPPAWTNSEIACARLSLNGNEYVSDGFVEDDRHLVSSVTVNGTTIGRLEVGYIIYPAGYDSDPFLPEERELIDHISREIAKMIEQRDTSAKLSQAQRMEAVGQLTGGIAHDFNNLLMILFGNLELAEDFAPESGPLRQCLANARHASQRASDLTRQLLAFSRQQRLTPERLNVNDLVGRMLKLTQRTLGESISVEMRLADELPEVKVDPSQLETAILNLALNARDAMPEGGEICIETSIRTLDKEYAALHGEQNVQPGTYVELSVADTGSGMPPETLRHIFEPFFTTKGVGQGTGLGLSMVYGFVMQSGGHVRVSSEPSKGTTFRIYLPIVSQEEDTEEVKAPSEATHFEGQGEVLLLVEDEPDVLAYMRTILEAAHYQVKVAEDGPTALEMLRSAPQPDLLVTDVGLPGRMDGVQLAHAGREMRPDLKVILISGHGTARLASADALNTDLVLLAKPFQRTEFLERIRLVLESNRVAHSAA